jgi:ABC-type uncharacterized transport system involved in gliding motility auxiliary subunit
MGKITIEFDLVEESHDARVALDAMKWKMAMWDLDQLLRGTTKYAASLVDPSQQATNEEIDVAHKVRDELREILTGYGLNLED